MFLSVKSFSNWIKMLKKITNNSNPRKMKVWFTQSGKWHYIHAQLIVTPWTIVHQAPLSMGILQEIVLEWVAMPSSRGSSQPRDQTQVFHVTGRFFTIWATWEAHEYCCGSGIPSPRDLPNPGIKLGSNCIIGGFFTVCNTREALQFRSWMTKTEGNMDYVVEDKNWSFQFGPDDQVEKQYYSNDMLFGFVLIFVLLPFPPSFLCFFLFFWYLYISFLLICSLPSENSPINCELKL